MVSPVVVYYIHQTKIGKAKKKSLLLLAYFLDKTGIISVQLGIQYHAMSGMVWHWHNKLKG